MKRTLKAVVAGAGMALTLAVQFLPDGPWKLLVTGVIGVGTTYGVWKAPYLPTPPPGVTGPYVGR